MTVSADPSHGAQRATMEIEGKPWFNTDDVESFTVARLLVILTRFLFNLPELPEKPNTLDEGSKERWANVVVSRLILKSDHRWLLKQDEPVSNTTAVVRDNLQR